MENGHMEGQNVDDGDDTVRLLLMVIMIKK